ncbi:MAG: hypothetical protein J6X35_04445 [Bacteroidales bacterium]|nr:hypothetical protein [Bacteroidales bacterium]
MIRKQRLHLLLLAALLASCGRGTEVTTEEQEVSDPTTTYSIDRPENGDGIEFISENGDNPLKTREFIKNYIIPENSFTAKRAKFYSMMDRLRLQVQSDSVRYDEVDSLNYMAIHYLLALLRDPKRIHEGIRHPMLRCVSSPDKRLKIYSWNENIAPGQQSDINVFQYREPGCAPVALFPGNGGTHDETDFRTGQMERIHPLYRKGDSLRIYLAYFHGSQGNEHNYCGFGCIRVLPDSLDFDYPAFDRQQSFVTLHGSGSRKVQGSFDIRNRQLKLCHIPDDDGGKSYSFDGSYFTTAE